MSNLLSSLTSAQLHQAARLKEKIEALTEELASLTGSEAPLQAAPKQKRRLSAASRAKIVAAQKARWAKYNAAKKGGTKPAAKPSTPKRTLSAEARAKIVAAQKARWAKVKAAKQA